MRKTTPDESERDEEGATPIKPNTSVAGEEPATSNEKVQSGSHEVPSMQAKQPKSQTDEANAAAEN